VRRKSTVEQNLHVVIGSHHTVYNGFEGRRDIAARKLLSHYAYKNCLLVSLKRSSRLQHRDLHDGSVAVWPANVTDPLLAEEEKRLIIPQGGRCPCVQYRGLFLIQCEHEYNASKNVEKGKYDNQWYNREAYCKKVTDWTATSSFDNMDQSNLPPAIFLVLPTNSNNQDHQDDNDTDVVNDIAFLSQESTNPNANA
jgi:hypothetical protein